MSTATEPSASPFEKTMEQMRKSTQSALSLQQELLGQWTKMWSGTGQSQDDYAKRIQKVQTGFSEAVIDLMRKQREIFDRQHRAAIESLEETFRLVSSKDPEEFRDRSSALCRKMLEVMKETTEMQMRELQDANNKWLDLCRKNP